MTYEELYDELYAMLADIKHYEGDITTKDVVYKELVQLIKEIKYVQ